MSKFRVIAIIEKKPALNMSTDVEIGHCVLCGLVSASVDARVQDVDRIGNFRSVQARKKRMVRYGADLKPRQAIVLYEVCLI